MFRKERRKDSGFCDSFDEHTSTDSGHPLQSPDVVVTTPQHPASSLTSCLELDDWTPVQLALAESVEGSHSPVPPRPPPRRQRSQLATDENRRRPVPPKPSLSRQDEFDVLDCDGECNSSVVTASDVVIVDYPPTPPPRPLYTLRL